MKKLILTISLLLISVSSHSKDIKGEMRCEVKSNYVVSNKEGNPKVFSGFKDSFEVGDNLYFKFSIEGFDPEIQFNGYVYFQLFDVKGKRIDGAQYYAEDVITLRNGIRWSVEYGVTYIDRDDIQLRFLFGNLVLSRYYKSDWSGIYLTHNPTSMSAQIATLDCRQSSDRVDEFIDYVKKLSK